MGVVIRQSAKQSIINAIAVLIGAINVIFIYPFALTKAELGLVRFIIDTGTLFMPLVLFGLNQVSVKFYPFFKTDNGKNNGFLSFLLIALSISCLLFCLLVWMFNVPIYEYYTNQNTLYENVLFLFVPLTILMSFYVLLTSISQNVKRIVVPQFFNSIYLKVGIAILILLYYFQIISLQQIFYGIIGIYVLINLSHLVYLKSLNLLHFNLDFKQFLDSKKVKQIGIFAAFGVLNAVGTVIVMRIDSFMVSTLAGLDFNGVYTIAAFIANTIDAPIAAVMGITAPLVSQFWKEENITEIENLYKRSSLNLLIIGCTLMLCIFVGIDYLFEIMPNGEQYAVGKYVILILGFSKLFDMATSINQHIIGFSKWFKFNFYALLFLSIFNIACNWFLIPLYDINGAAIASFTAIVLFNILKFVFIYHKMKIQPFSKQTIWVLCIALIIGLIGWWLPINFHPIINLVVKCGLVASLFMGAIYYFNISEEINNTVKQIIFKISGK